MTIVSLSLSLDVFTLTFQSCLFCYFSPQQIIFTFTHQLYIFHPSGCFNLFWHDDTIVQGGPRFSPMHSPVRYRRYSPISPLRYISYHLSGTFSAIMSYVRSVNEVSTQNKCCWPSDLRHHHLFHHLRIGCSPRRKLRPRGVVPGLNNHQGHHLRLTLRCWGNSSIPEGRFSKWF